LNRRDFLKVSLAGTMAFGLPTLLRGQAGKITILDGGGTNVVAFSTSEGLILVDSGAPKNGDKLLSALKAFAPNAKVQTVFNTHYHLDQTGNNEVFAAAGAKIIAHENTKLWLGTDILVEWENRTYPARPKNALPNQTFYTTGKMTFGKHEIRYGHLGQAHTDGDIYVFFPAENILITGDVFRVGAYPIPDYCTNGWLGGLANATKALVGLTDAKTRVVPGSGPVQTRAELESQFEMCNTLKNRIAQLMKEGKGANEIIAAAPTKEFDAKWGNPKVFMSVVYRGLWSHVRELGGIV